MLKTLIITYKNLVKPKVQILVDVESLNVKSRTSVLTVSNAVI